MERISRAPGHTRFISFFSFIGQEQTPLHSFMIRNFTSLEPSPVTPVFRQPSCCLHDCSYCTAELNVLLLLCCSGYVTIDGNPCSVTSRSYVLHITYMSACCIRFILMLALSRTLVSVSHCMLNRYMFLSFAVLCVSSPKLICKLPQAGSNTNAQVVLNICRDLVSSLIDSANDVSRSACGVLLTARYFVHESCSSRRVLPVSSHSPGLRCCRC